MKIFAGRNRGTDKEPKWDLAEINVGFVKKMNERNNSVTYSNRSFIRDDETFGLGTNLFRLQTVSGENIFNKADDEITLFFDQTPSNIVLKIETITFNKTWTKHTAIVTIRNKKYGMLMVCFTDIDRGLYIMVPPYITTNIEVNSATIDDVLSAAKKIWLAEEDVFKVGTCRPEYLLLGFYSQSKNGDAYPSLEDAYDYFNYYFNAAGLNIGATIQYYTYSQYVVGLETYWNWYEFIKNKPEISTATIQADNGDLIEMSRSYDIFRREEYTTDNGYVRKSFISPNYQLGTDLSNYLNVDKDVLTFKNGAVMSMSRVQSSTAPFNISWTIQDGDSKIGYDEISTFSFPVTGGSYLDYLPLNYYDRLKGTEWSIGSTNYFRNPGTMTLWLSNDYTKGIKTELTNKESEYNEDNNSVDFRFFDDAPCMIAGTCNGLNYDNSYQEWLDINKEYIPKERFYGWVLQTQLKWDMYFNTVTNGFHSFDDTTVHGMNIAEDWRKLLGISKTIEPNRPNNGGEGGKYNDYGGGQGTFDDTSDNIGLPSTTTGVSAIHNLFTLYCLSIENVSSMGTWLNETSSIFSHSDKLSGIISLKKLKVPSPNLLNPAPTETINIVGENSGAMGTRISSQYEIIYLGSHTFTEYFGSYLDYTETEIELSLPYSGVYQLNTADVMGKTCNLNVMIDYFTGDIAYLLSVVLEDTESVIYTFNGNCGMDIPITATDYAGKTAAQINTALSLGAGIVAVATQGATMLPMVGATTLSNAFNAEIIKPSYKRAGSISGQTGNLGVQYPYLIITRPKMNFSENYPAIQGYPSNLDILLGELIGYAEIGQIYLNGLSTATNEEIDELETILKSGVIF